MLNDYYQNIGMKGFIQRYGIVNAVKRGAFMFIKLHLVKDYEVRKVLWQERASTKIKPYLKYKDIDVEVLSFPKNDVENPIWIYWNKGIEQAPIIVQKCYESVCKHSNQKIILLNDQNLANYIRLPDYIEKKKDAGQIPMAGYADLMRFALLEHYGGTWIDSTVYLTDPIPDMILNSDFFAVRNSLLLIDNPVLYIKYADYVVTNSFHGTAFSVIFHKDFYVEALQKDFKPNDRVESLLCLTGLDGCKVKTLEDCRLNVSRDFNFADDQIRKQYIKTNQYFERVLNEDGRSF